MSFDYNANIPAAPNNPSIDQPKMLVNTQSIQNLIKVDHHDFNSTDAGKHLQTTFVSKNTPAAQTDPQSVLYTANGVESTVAELNYVNQSGTFPLSFIKAMGSFTAISGAATPVAITPITQFNVTSITRLAALGIASYNMAIPANVITGTNVAVLVTYAGTGTTPTWTYSANLLQIFVTTSTTGIISFIIMQV